MGVIASLAMLLIGTTRVTGAELSAGDTPLAAGATGNVVVSGNIAGESALGVTILLQLVPRANVSGTVTFTPSPPVDIVQDGDPWPGQGTFTPFDTDPQPAGTGGLDLNGSVDDNGIFQPAPVTFSGPLGSFPVIASADAAGVWDVLLTTPVGTSTWEAGTAPLPTTLIAGTVTVTPSVGLSVASLSMAPASTQNLVVSGKVNNLPALGVTVLVQLVPVGTPFGTLTFTPAPPVDVIQVGDPWPGLGLFTAFDTDPQPAGTGSPDLNGSVDDNGSFQASTINFNGPLSSFPVVASPDADGTWEVRLTTTNGNSTWETDGGPLTTVLTGGTITVTPAISLTANNLSVPPGGTSNLVVSGDVVALPLVGVTILTELIPRPGAVGTLTFTPSPPTDIIQLGDPWPGLGTFSVFDTDPQPVGTGSDTLNGSVDDNGTFLANPVTFSGPLSSFPIVAGPGASGVWDVTLTTSLGASGWDNLSGIRTTLIDGTVTVVSGACIVDLDCDDGNVCTVDVCTAGVCFYSNVAGTCSDGDPCTTADACAAGVCVGGPPVDCALAGDQCNVASCDPLGIDGNCAVLTPVLDGTLCDDGVICSIGETCQVGVCTGSAPVDCTPAGDQCNVASCDPLGLEGNCNIITPVVDGTPCDDGSACDVGETCQLGVCTIGGPVDCSTVGGQCNIASCDPLALEGNCDISVPVVDGTACDDGNVCNTGEACLLGACVGGLPVDCTPLNTQCATVSCDALGVEGNCAVVTPVLDGTVCDDALFCTLTDQCLGGTCTGSGDPCPGQVCDEGIDLCVECLGNLDCDDGNVCTDDVCVARACVITPNTLSCDDGDACTLGDLCAAGTCQPGTAVDCSTAGDQCNVASCDSLGAVGNCAVLTPVPNGSICNDGLLCTISDGCVAGTCTGTPRDCSALDSACGVGSCDPGNGTCVAGPINEGGPCDDGLPCTTGDTCVAGQCVGNVPGGVSPVDLTWSPGSQVVQVGQTVSIDVIAVSASCVSQAIGSIEIVLLWDPAVLELLGKVDVGPFAWASSSFPNDQGLDGLNAPFTGTPANDGDALYQALTNFQSGATVTPSGLLVTRFQFRALDGTQGTSISIAATAGLFSRSSVLGAGANLGVDLTGALGSATVGVTECQLDSDCDDGNVCTTEVCTVGVCAFTNNTLPCNDGLFCTAGDTCAGGVCVGGADPCGAPSLCSESLDACVQCLSAAGCDDGNICTDNLCDLTGTCQFPNNTLPCDDNQFCTPTDTCVGGTCIGTGDTCPGAVCDEANNLCVQCLVNGDCNDGNVCTDDVCSGNICSNPPNVLPCTDGLFCTSGDQCSGGVCVGGSDPCIAPSLCSEQLNACVQCLNDQDCDDGNTCTTNTCFLASGTCLTMNNTLPCDDGLFCTAVDVCSQGVCVGSGDQCPGLLCDEPGDACVQCFSLLDCPDDGVVCTDDACISGVCVHTPNAALCSDGVFCNGAETCDAVLDCLPATNPCDDPALCDEVNDLCGCQTPTVVAEGSRYVAITPRPGNTPVALRVTGVDPDVACVSMYVGTDGVLRTTPVFQRPAVWATAHARGIEIRPSTTYAVQVECETGQGLGFSSSRTATTWLWGDTDNSGGLVDILDLTNVVDVFAGRVTSVTLFGTDLWGIGQVCTPQRLVDIQDMTRAVDAFKQTPFSCARPCP